MLILIFTIFKAKKYLAGSLDRFYTERLYQSDESIASKAASNLSDNDVVVTFGQ